MKTIIEQTPDSETPPPPNQKVEKLLTRLEQVGLLLLSLLVFGAWLMVIGVYLLH
jgi:hypothetical protein